MTIKLVLSGTGKVFGIKKIDSRDGQMSTCPKMALPKPKQRGKH